MNNTLLPGFNKQPAPLKVVDRELLRIAQQMARQHEGWSLANAVLREAYGK